RAAVRPSGRQGLDARDEGGARDGLCHQHEELALLDRAVRLRGVARPGAARREGRQDERDGTDPADAPLAPHANAFQLLMTRPIAKKAANSTPIVSSTRRRLQRWIETCSRSGAIRRNSARRSRPSCLRWLRNWVGLATPRAAANASAISSSEKYVSA